MDGGRPPRRSDKSLRTVKILLIGDYPPEENESVPRFIEALVRGFAARGHAPSVIRPEPRFGRPKSRSQSWRRHLARLGYVDRYLLFPPRLKRAASQFDVVHVVDQQDAVYVRFLGHVPHLVSCHDLIAVRVALGEIPEEQFDFVTRLRQRAILRGLERAQKVACISEATRADLLRLTRRAADDLRVVYNGLNYPYAPMDGGESEPRLRRLGLDPAARFYLHVGSDVFYKNRVGLLLIFAALRRAEGFGDARLVLVGKPLAPGTLAIAEAEGLSAGVFVAGRVDNEDLRALYSRSAGLIYPSLYEGFGWPPLEAMACGCPVFTSNRAPMTEVGGAAARYFDPNAPAEAARLIARSAGDRERMRADGLVNARRFTTEAMVEGYLAAYEAAIREGPPGRFVTSPRSSGSSG